MRSCEKRPVVDVEADVPDDCVDIVATLLTLLDLDERVREAGVIAVGVVGVLGLDTRPSGVACMLKSIIRRSFRYDTNQRRTKDISFPSGTSPSSRRIFKASLQSHRD